MRHLNALAAAATAVAVLATASPALARPATGEFQSRRGILKTIKENWRVERQQEKNEGRDEKKDDKKSDVFGGDATCLRPVVAARESAVLAAFKAFSVSTTNALSVRASALDGAWISTDVSARAEAVTDAWDAYGTSSKAARKTLREARDAAWKVFNDAAKKCGGTSIDESAGVDTTDDLSL
ncbi:MAG: hypothetical protein KBC95_04600 [Candidatus Peribacteraceae bacterium]|nr:hypothetical protein [Candidatus Peribacteraceae bacterium]